MDINILFVEDDPDDFKQIHRQVTAYFCDKSCLKVNIDGVDNFTLGLKYATDPHRRYDLIVSDTYKGEHKNLDAAVLDMVSDYKQNKRFCPIIVCSSGICPPALEDAKPFINWVEKASPDLLDNALDQIFELQIPQLSRSLHDEIDSATGKFLWGFLEEEWKELNHESPIDPIALERLIRTRASLVLSELSPGLESYVGIQNKHGLEYYIYPSLDHKFYNLGDIIRCKDDHSDIRVILTPHCHLYFNETNRSFPKTEYVLTLKTVPIEEVLGKKLENLKTQGRDSQLKKLSQWARSPSATDREPNGRHWYLPKFLEIPHLFCDLLQLESVPYDSLEPEFQRLATLTRPYAEALQECFSSFYGSVGIPEINPESILDIIK